MDTYDRVDRSRLRNRYLQINFKGIIFLSILKGLRHIMMRLLFDKKSLTVWIQPGFLNQNYLSRKDRSISPSNTVVAGPVI